MPIATPPPAGVPLPISLPSRNPAAVEGAKQRFRRFMNTELLSLDAGDGIEFTTWALRVGSVEAAGYATDSGGKAT